MLAFVGVGDEALVGAVGGDLLVARGEEAGLADAVGEHEEGDAGHEQGGQTLDEEEDAPRGHAAADEQDGVAEGAAVGVGEGAARDEDALAEADLVARVEEGEVDGHAGVHGLEDAEEEADGGEAGKVAHRGLQRREGRPGEDDAGAPDVRGEVLPAGDAPHGDDV